MSRKMRIRLATFTGIFLGEMAVKKRSFFAWDNYSPRNLQKKNLDLPEMPH
jgi:hypothetical protein